MHRAPLKLQKKTDTYKEPSSKTSCSREPVQRLSESFNLRGGSRGGKAMRKCKSRETRGMGQVQMLELVQGL